MGRKCLSGGNLSQVSCGIKSFEAFVSKRADGIRQEEI